MVQELILRPHVIRYRCERWITPDGRTVVAALPAGTVGHFGPELRRFVLAQYHPGQVTVPRIVAHLRDLGMAISKRQVVRLLIAGKEDFLAEAAGVLKPGFSIASDICDRVHLAGIPHVGTDPRGKACQNRSGLASRLLLTVGVGHVRDRGGWGPWRRPILGSTRHSRRTGPVIGQR